MTERPWSDLIILGGTFLAGVALKMFEKWINGDR